MRQPLKLGLPSMAMTPLGLWTVPGGSWASSLASHGGTLTSLLPRRIAAREGITTGTIQSLAKGLGVLAMPVGTQTSAALPPRNSCVPSWTGLGPAAAPSATPTMRKGVRSGRYGLPGGGRRHQPGAGLANHQGHSAGTRKVIVGRIARGAEPFGTYSCNSALYVKRDSWLPGIFLK